LRYIQFLFEDDIFLLKLNKLLAAEQELLPII
jgi:hypothetical protein